MIRIIEASLATKHSFEKNKKKAISVLTEVVKKIEENSKEGLNKLNYKSDRLNEQTKTSIRTALEDKGYTFKYDYEHHGSDSGYYLTIGWPLEEDLVYQDELKL